MFWVLTIELLLDSFFFDDIYSLLLILDEIIVLLLWSIRSNLLALPLYFLVHEPAIIVLPHQNANGGCLLEIVVLVPTRIYGRSIRILFLGIHNLQKSLTIFEEDIQRTRLKPRARLPKLFCLRL
jgi:hypothetical protein